MISPRVQDLPRDLFSNAARSCADQRPPSAQTQLHNHIRVCQDAQEATNRRLSAINKLKHFVMAPQNL